MSFPQVQDADTQSAVQASDSNSWTLTYPSNLQTGDLIVAFMSIDGSVSVPGFPASWVTDRGTNVEVTLAYSKKKALGTESGNFNVSLASAQQGCWQVLRITGWEGTLGTSWGNGAAGGSAIFAGITGTSTTPDPPGLNPAMWDVEDTLWIAVSAADGGDTTHTGFPGSYTNTSAQESGGADGASLGIARRENAVVTENPTAFTIDVSEEWISQVFGIRPSSLQEAAPSADSVDGAWTNQADGTSLFEAIDEASASDTDYIRSELSPSNSGCRVKIASLNDPGVSSGHEIKWRPGKSSTGGDQIDMIVKLYQGGGDSLGAGTLIADFTRTNVDSFTTYTETLSSGEADSITNYADLYLEFYADIP